VRPLAPRERAALGCARLTVSGVRLEVWRYRYAGEGRVLRGEKLVEARAARE
jgi:hypothetical protein